MVDKYTNMAIDATQRAWRWVRMPNDADRLSDAIKRVKRHGLRVSLYERQDGAVDVRLMDIDGLTIVYYTERLARGPVRRAAAAIEGALREAGLE